MSSNDISFASLIVAALALVVAVLAVVLQYLDFFQRRRDKELPVRLDTFEEEIDRPLRSHWTIRVRANRYLERCRVTFDGTRLKTVIAPNNIREEVPVDKGGGFNFRIPIEMPVSTASLVVVLDGDEPVRQMRWGELPQTHP